MMIKGFQSCFKVVGRSIYFFHPVESELDVFEQIELGLQANDEPHWHWGLKITNLFEGQITLFGESLFYFFW